MEPAVPAGWRRADEGQPAEQAAPERLRLAPLEGEDRWIRAEGRRCDERGVPADVRRPAAAARGCGDGRGRGGYSLSST